MNTPHKRLPSYQSAIDFIEDPNLTNAVRVGGSWFGRGLIVAVGMAISGQPFERALKNGLIAATSIEVFVLGHAVYDVHQSKKALPDASQR